MKRKRKCCIIIYLVLATIVLETDARIRASTSKSLQKIKTTLTSAGKRVQPRIDKIKDYLNSEEGVSQTEAVSSSIEQIAGAVPKLTSTDTTEIVTGVLDEVSAVTSLIPVVGPIISTVFSLISTIISAIGGSSSQDIGSIVRKEIENALNKFDDSNLRAEAHGTARMYRNSHSYLSAKEGENQLQEHEIASLSSHIPIYQGVKFLGILTSKIKDNTVSQNLDQVKRAMEYTKLYVILAVLRSAVLWEMYSVVRGTSHSGWTAAAVKRVAEAEEETDKRFMQYLGKPEYSQAVFFASFSISEWPEISTFLEKKGLQFQNLNNLATGVHTLRPQRWANWYMIMNDDKKGRIIGRKWPGTQGKFFFDVVSAVDNVFYLRPQKWPHWYMYMEDSKKGYCRGWEGKPGPQGEWKVVKFTDGKYMLSPRKWQNWFIYMQDNDEGTVRGWKGDPDIQGHWIIG